MQLEMSRRFNLSSMPPSIPAAIPRQPVVMRSHVANSQSGVEGAREKLDSMCKNNPPCSCIPWLTLSLSCSAIPQEANCSSCGALNIVQSNDPQPICLTCGYFFEPSHPQSHERQSRGLGSNDEQRSFGSLAQRRSLAVLTAFGPSSSSSSSNTSWDTDKKVQPNINPNPHCDC